MALLEKLKCRECTEDFKRLKTASRQYCSKTCKTAALKANPNRRAAVKKRTTGKNTPAKTDRTKLIEQEDYIEFNILRESMGLSTITKKEYLKIIRSV